MKSKYYALVPEDWKCESCNRDRDATTFSFRFNKTESPYLYKRCNYCLIEKKVCKARKKTDYDLRAKISQDFKEYFARAVA